jgi:hypothetical protein
MRNKLREIESVYNANCAPKHIMFATWLAHYKFFWEQQIGWIEENRKFSFFRDKFPLTFWVSIVAILTVFIFNCTDLGSFIKSVCIISGDTSD